jgi:hypothetical protein
MCAAACSARTTKPRQARTISPHTPLTCTRYHNMPPLRDHSLSRTPDAERAPMRNATHAETRPCTTRPHADLDSKAYASFANTTTPAPKGRNSLAQGVSPVTAPRKEPSPGGATACAPAHSTSSALLLTSIPINIDIHQSKLSSPSPGPLPRPPQASHGHPPGPLLLPEHSRPRLLS